jgi:hypothetical protein
MAKTRQGALVICDDFSIIIHIDVVNSGDIPGRHTTPPESLERNML